MKKVFFIILLISGSVFRLSAATILHNEYAYLQEITFELYTDDVPAYKVPEDLKSIEETLMFDVLHATWKDKHWVAYTLNKNLLGTYKVGQPALLDNGSSKKIFFVAAFPGSAGGLDLYTAEYSNGKWSKPKNLGKEINTSKNESNPGLLNDYTLTYSSGGIIKKLNLKTFKVVDLEESKPEENKKDETEKETIVRSTTELKRDKEQISAIGDNSTAAPSGTTTPVNNDYGAIGDNSTAAPVNSGDGRGALDNQVRTANDQIVVQEKTKIETQQQAPRSNQPNNTYTTSSVTAPAPVASVMPASVKSLGTQSREAMLAKYKTAIQLGAFSTPKWEQLGPLSKFGQLITYKNDKGANVVWIVGFANRAAAEAVLPQIKATAGFEGAYVTGK